LIVFQVLHFALCPRGQGLLPKLPQLIHKVLFSLISGEGIAIGIFDNRQQPLQTRKELWMVGKVLHKVSQLLGIGCWSWHQLSPLLVNERQKDYACATLLITPIPKQPHYNHFLYLKKPSIPKLITSRAMVQ